MPSGGPAWLLTRSALAQLLTDPVVRDGLRSARVYEILQPGQHALAGVTAEPVVTFASAASLENAIRHGQLGTGIYGVLYDPEAWSFTPVTEQRDPIRAAARAAVAGYWLNIPGPGPRCPTCRPARPDAIGVLRQLR